MGLVANLLLSLTVKELKKNRSAFIEGMNEYRVARFYGSRCI